MSWSGIKCGKPKEAWDVLTFSIPSNPVSMKTPKVQRPMSIVQQRNKGNAPMKKKKNPAVDDNVGKQRKSK